MTSNAKPGNIMGSMTTDQIVRALAEAGQQCSALLRDKKHRPIAAELLAQIVGSGHALVSQRVNALADNIDISKAPPDGVVFRLAGNDGAAIPVVGQRTNADLRPTESYNATTAITKKAHVGLKTVFVATLPANWLETAKDQIDQLDNTADYRATGDRPHLHAAERDLVQAANSANVLLIKELHKLSNALKDYVLNGGVFEPAEAIVIAAYDPIAQKVWSAFLSTQDTGATNLAFELAKDAKADVFKSAGKLLHQQFRITNDTSAYLEQTARELKAIGHDIHATEEHQKVAALAKYAEVLRNATSSIPSLHTTLNDKTNAMSLSTEHFVEPRIIKTGTDIESRFKRAVAVERQNSGDRAARVQTVTAALTRTKAAKTDITAKDDVWLDTAYQLAATGSTIALETFTLGGLDVESRVNSVDNNLVNSIENANKFGKITEEMVRESITIPVDISKSLTGKLEAQKYAGADFDYLDTDDGRAMTDYFNPIHGKTQRDFLTAYIDMRAKQRAAKGQNKHGKTDDWNRTGGKTSGDDDQDERALATKLAAKYGFTKDVQVDAIDESLKVSELTDDQLQRLMRKRGLDHDDASNGDAPSIEEVAQVDNIVARRFLAKQTRDGFGPGLDGTFAHLTEGLSQGAPTRKRVRY